MTIETTYELYELYNGATGREQVEIGTFGTLDDLLAKITPQSERQELKKVFGVGTNATRLIYHVVNKTSGWTMHKYFVKVVETLNYDQPQPLADTSEFAVQDAKDKYFNQLAAEIRELEQAARAERKSKRQPQPMPTVTLDDIEIVQVDLFCGIVDTHLAYLDATQPIPAYITADTLPELMNKLDAAGFDMDATLMVYWEQTQDSERVPNTPQPQLITTQTKNADWAWQPFGPQDDVLCFTAPGSHYRGFPVIKISDGDKSIIEQGLPVSFMYKKVQYICQNGEVKVVEPERVPNGSAE